MSTADPGLDPTADGAGARPYQPPVVTDLGTLADLTEGASGENTDPAQMAPGSI